MKQVHANYTFVASTKTITLTGLNIAQDQLLLVTNATRGVIYYNFASSSHRAVVTAGANTTVVLTDASTTGHADSDQLTIHYDDQLSTQTIAGTVTANLFEQQYNSNIPVFVAAYVDSPGGSVIPVSQDANAGMPISGTVTVGNSVTIGSLPAISGTVTANLASAVTINSAGTSFSNRVVSKSELKFEAVAGAIDTSKFSDTYTLYPLKITAEAEGRNLSADLRTTSQGNDLSAIATDATAAFVRTQVVGGSVTIGSLPAISGTVTANGGNFLNSQNALITNNSANNLVLLGGLSYSSTPTQSAIDALRTDGNGQIRVYQQQTFWTDTNQGNQARAASQQTPFPVQVLGGSVTIGSLPALTPQLPRVTFIDGSGTVTTANTAITVFASSSTRSYLLVQVTTGSAFVNVGATATTLNGISLTAGQGYAWETTIPQGAVSLISTTTSSRYVAKEA